MPEYHSLYIPRSAIYSGAIFIISTIFSCGATELYSPLLIMRPYSSNRYSMPVTRSRNGLYEMNLDQTNTTRFLFGDDEPNAMPRGHTPDESFPTLVRREDHMVSLLDPMNTIPFLRQRWISLFVLARDSGAICFDSSTGNTCHHCTLFTTPFHFAFTYKIGNYFFSSSITCLFHPSITWTRASLAIALFNTCFHDIFLL